MTRRDTFQRPDGRIEADEWPDAPEGVMAEHRWVWVVDTEAVPGVYDEETGETITEPVAEVGHWEMVVTTRAMTEAEVEQWHADNPPPPLVPEDQRLDDDTMAASIALLTEDSVGYRAMLHVITQALQIPDAVIEQAQAAATERLVALAENPEVRRAMMADRIARAEAARGE